MILSTRCLYSKVRGGGGRWEGERGGGALKRGRKKGETI